MRPDHAQADAANARPDARASVLSLVFVANAAVLGIAVLLLALSPITIDTPIQAGQLVVLLVGFVLLVALNLLLVRRVLSPLIRLTEVMSSVDPERPGRRISRIDSGTAEGQALAEAFNDMLDRLETARHDAARTALAAQEAERLRVAQELHDGIGQTLTAVSIGAERAADDDAAAARDALRQVAGAIRESLDEVRRIARELRPEALDDLGLVNALIALANRMGTEAGMRIRRDLETSLPPLSPEAELVLYRIAQEAITNALRHARAGSIGIALEADADKVTLRVTDDGIGMPPTLPAGTAGIAGMRERALLVGARLSIESAPAGGTEVRLTIPAEAEGP